SKIPTPLRTALCSAMIPPLVGYSTGISQPLNSTILAPIWRWTALRAVLRTLDVVASTADNEKSSEAVAGLLWMMEPDTLTRARRRLQPRDRLQASGSRSTLSWSHWLAVARHKSRRELRVPCGKG